VMMRAPEVLISEREKPSNMRASLAERPPKKKVPALPAAKPGLAGLSIASVDQSQTRTRRTCLPEGVK
jgi:hypothetical protein